MRDGQAGLIEKIMGECLGAAIGESREGKRLTQGDLARKLGKSRGSAVSEIESGKKRITAEELKMICEKLETPPLDIIDQAILFFRKEMARLFEGEGGFLLGAPPVTREEVESGFFSLTVSANEWMSRYLQYMRPPTEIESLRHSFRKGKRGSADREE